MRVLVFVVGVLFPISVWAHGIHCFTGMEGGKAFVFAYFSNGEPVKHADVKVFLEDKLFTSGKTGEDGYFYFTPESGSYKVRVDAGMGHMAECTLSVSAESGRVEGVKSVHLDRRLDDIEKRLSRIELELKKQRFRDIIAGLGWIMGIFGAVMFVMGVKR